MKQATASIRQEWLGNWCAVLVKPDGSFHSFHGMETDEQARRSAEAYAKQQEVKLIWKN